MGNNHRVGAYRLVNNFLEVVVVVKANFELIAWINVVEPFGLLVCSHEFI